MSTFANLFFAMAESMAQPIEDRRVALDTIDGFGISTVLSSDMGYETALGSSDDNWHPVERYDSREESVVGHARWVAKIQSGEREFVKLGYGDLMDDESLILS